jgi:Fe-Mn family superoxide dismutase
MGRFVKKRAMNESRRNFLKKSSLLAIAGMGATILPTGLSASNFTGLLHEPFTLPKLPYSYDALEPHIDKMTMEIHHTKHHQAYVDNLNKAIAEGNIHASLEELIDGASKFSPAIRNNGGGHWNHSFFWKLMKPGGGGNPTGKIAGLIQATFGSFETFKTKLEEAGTKRFGSGWAWLVMDANNKLAIGSTPNQDNPLMDVAEVKGTPLLGVDVWEHAYYLKYQNRRAEYLGVFWNVVNWNKVSERFEKASQ